MGQLLQSMLVVQFFGERGIRPMIDNYQDQKPGQNFWRVLDQTSERCKEIIAFGQGGNDHGPAKTFLIGPSDLPRAFYCS
jgi:hypothetical protein